MSTTAVLRTMTVARPHRVTVNKISKGNFVLTMGQLQNKEEIREKYFLRIEQLNLDLGAVAFIQNNFNAVILKLQKILSEIGIVETVMNNGLIGQGLLGFIQSIIPNLTHRFYSKFKKKKRAIQKTDKMKAYMYFICKTSHSQIPACYGILPIPPLSKQTSKNTS